MSQDHCENFERHSWWQLATQRSVVQRGFKVASVVGTILVSINHLPSILAGQIDRMRIIQIGLTYLVPYCVSTWSSVAAIREIEKRRSNRSE